MIFLSFTIKNALFGDILSFFIFVFMVFGDLSENYWFNGFIELSTHHRNNARRRVLYKYGLEN